MGRPSVKLDRNGQVYITTVVADDVKEAEGYIGALTTIPHGEPIAWSVGEGDDRQIHTHCSLETVLGSYPEGTKVVPMYGLLAKQQT